MSERNGSDNDGEGRRAASATEGEDTPRPFIDSVFDALADWRRREICLFFSDGDVNTATVDELALLLEACEPAGVEVDRERTHEDIVTDLAERHLPRLDAAGVIDFDERSQTVRYWGQPTVEKWLEHVTAVERHEA